jgi:RHS repeat-associated protein
MLEETHYYPDGLIMAGISDKAWNKLQNNYHYQGNEIQNQEWNDGSGLEEDDFNARFYDPQLGRWNTQDPAGQYASPYLGMGNNWMNGVDPNGTSFWSTLEDIGLIGAGVAATILTSGGALAAAAVGAGGYAGASLESGNWNPGKWDDNAWKGAVTGELIAGSAVVGGEDIFAPAALTGPGANIAVGAAIGVGQNVASTLVQDEGKWDWNDQFSASVSGAISGAFQSGAMQNGFDNLTSTGSWGWGQPNVTGSLSGVTSDIAGSILSTSAKTAISGGHWFDNVATNVTSSILGQVAHNFVSAGGSFIGSNGNNLNKNDNSVSNWVAGPTYPQYSCSHFFLYNTIFNFTTNSAAALMQQVFFTGNLFSSRPLAGIFDGISLLSNLAPNTTAGWTSDQFNSWNP